MKKYRVSLGVRIWANWEIEIEADDEKDAEQQAVRLFGDNNSSGEYTNPYYDEAELMGDDAVHIEEIEDEE